MKRNEEKSMALGFAPPSSFYETFLINASTIQLLNPVKRPWYLAYPVVG